MIRLSGSGLVQRHYVPVFVHPSLLKRRFFGSVATAGNARDRAVTEGADESKKTGQRQSHDVNYKADYRVKVSAVPADPVLHFQMTVQIQTLAQAR
jgi:hypothetical protein